MKALFRGALVGKLRTSDTDVHKHVRTAVQQYSYNINTCSSSVALEGTGSSRIESNQEKEPKNKRNMFTS